VEEERLLVKLRVPLVEETGKLLTGYSHVLIVEVVDIKWYKQHVQHVMEEVLQLS